MSVGLLAFVIELPVKFFLMSPVFFGVLTNHAYTVTLLVHKYADILHTTRTSLTHTHTHSHTHTHTHTHTYTSIHTHTHAYTRIHTHTYAYTHIHTHTYTHNV